jgi:hypothetical protein
MERTEATAEASFAAERERRRLGMAMAATIRITETTTNNSIREKPFASSASRMNSSKATYRLPRPPSPRQSLSPCASSCKISPGAFAIEYMFQRQNVGFFFLGAAQDFTAALPWRDVPSWITSCPRSILIGNRHKVAACPERRRGGIRKSRSQEWSCERGQQNDRSRTRR